MKLKYTGPKEIISHHGVSFKKGKDDKYVYIYPSLQIYKAIHHDYEKDKVYTYNIKGERLTNDELLEKIISLRVNLEDFFKDKIEKLNIKLENEIDDVHLYADCNKEELKVYESNLVIMKNYRLQRDTNKIVYNKLIEIIVDDIIENRIKEINAPFNERFWHIFQTLQGELSNHNHRSIGSKLDIEHDANSLGISLKINSIGK